ncbi:MAG: zinc-ribbon domain-containing protein [Bifidobacteriaceae bacterium]|nr:zinc-ribbon domain-containing protein [Bifidobacteriaceae bacterium]
MFCPNCGKPTPEGAIICLYCGARIDDVQNNVENQSTEYADNTAANPNEFEQSAPSENVNNTNNVVEPEQFNTNNVENQSALNANTFEDGAANQEVFNGDPAYAQSNNLADNNGYGVDPTNSFENGSDSQYAAPANNFDSNSYPTMPLQDNFAQPVDINNAAYDMNQTQAFPTAENSYAMPVNNAMQNGAAQNYNTVPQSYAQDPNQNGLLGLEDFAQPLDAAYAVKPHKPLYKMVWFWVILVLIVIGAAGYAAGSIYYNKDRQIDKIVQLVQDDKSDITDYVTSSGIEKIDASMLKPTRRYFKNHKSEKEDLVKSIKTGAKYKGFAIVESGKYWFLFPKYKLNVPAYEPSFSTNNSGSSLFIDNKKVGEFTKHASTNITDDDYYVYKYKTVLFGEYDIRIETKAGNDVRKISQVVVIDNNDVSMNMTLVSFEVHAIADAEIFVAGQSVGKTNESGILDVDNYMITNKSVVYGVKKVGDSEVKSEESKDLIKLVSSNNSNYYSSDDVIINLKWSGYADNSDVQNVLEDAFNAYGPSSSVFVNDEQNASYKELERMIKGFRNDDKISYYKMEIGDVVTSLAADGTTDVDNYMITNKSVVYGVKKVGDSEVKSEESKDLIKLVSSNNSNYYSSDDVIINLKWSGYADNSDVQNVLEDAFNAYGPSSSVFVNDEQNASYKELERMIKGFRNDDKISYYKMEIGDVVTSLAADGTTDVEYTVTYTFHHYTTPTHIQVLKYTNANVRTINGVTEINRIGGATIISDVTEDD